jgi:cbb3-type cytochrome oxidase subunit 3
MDSAIFFISGGVFMLVVAYVYRRWNKLAAAPAAADRGDDGDETAE